MTEKDGSFVTKDRLIYVLLAIIAFLGAQFITEKVSDIRSNTNEIQLLREDFNTLKADVGYIKATVTEIKKKVSP